MYILDFYFGEISLNTIISFSAKSNKGFTQELAIDVIKEVGLFGVARDMKALDIPNHFLPCIIFDEKDSPYILRKKLRKEGISKGFKVVFSEELPDTEAIIPVEEQNKKSRVGTISYLPAVFGCVAAQAALTFLLDRESS